MVKIHVVNRGHQQLPAYATAQSAGMDLRANLDAPITLHPMERRLIPTGLHIALPEGYEAQVRPRSGLALKHGLTVLNAPGTIDGSGTVPEVGIVVLYPAFVNTPVHLGGLFTLLDHGLYLVN